MSLSYSCRSRSRALFRPTGACPTRNAVPVRRGVRWSHRVQCLTPRGVSSAAARARRRPTAQCALRVRPTARAPLTRWCGHESIRWRVEWRNTADARTVARTRAASGRRRLRLCGQRPLALCLCGERGKPGGEPEWSCRCDPFTGGHARLSPLLVPAGRCVNLREMRPLHRQALRAGLRRDAPHAWSDARVAREEPKGLV